VGVLSHNNLPTPGRGLGFLHPLPTPGGGLGFIADWGWVVWVWVGSSWGWGCSHTWTCQHPVGAKGCCIAANKEHWALGSLFLGGLGLVGLGVAM